MAMSAAATTTGYEVDTVDEALQRSESTFRSPRMAAESRSTAAICFSKLVQMSKLCFATTWRKSLPAALTWRQ